MRIFDYKWQDEYLIYPVVKGAVSVIARVTSCLYIAAALFWLAGLGVLCCAPFRGMDVFPVLAYFNELSVACAVPCLYLLALWCHQVLLAGRGMTATRWLLLILLFFALLHPVCEAYQLSIGEPLLINQFLLPAVLYTMLLCIFLLNWFRMAALPLRYRVLLLLFLLSLLGQYILQGSFLILLLPCFSWRSLSILARYAPKIVCLPPRETSDK